MRDKDPKKFSNPTKTALKFEIPIRGLNLQEKPNKRTRLFSDKTSVGKSFRYVTDCTVTIPESLSSQG